MLGIAVVGLMLAGCADRATPSEATVESAAAPEHAALAAVQAPAGRLRTIAVLDDCLPTDPAWEDVGGCVLPGGLVNFADFLAALPQGHPSWRNDPAYAKINANLLRSPAHRSVNVVNHGGREHTFTRVAEFGGGIIPLLNAPGQQAAPECADQAAFGSSFLLPGASMQIEIQPGGPHRYQCCIHPWMRTELRVN